MQYYSFVSLEFTREAVDGARERPLRRGVQQAEQRGDDEGQKPDLQRRELRDVPRGVAPHERKRREAQPLLFLELSEELLAYVGTNFIRHQFIEIAKNFELSTSGSSFSATSKPKLATECLFCNTITRFKVYTTVIMEFPELSVCMFFAIL